ncbi:TlpA disulfide reductase family protein [Elizabethkingia sp. JS20170427COW]|uniref:TlpA disulfide reductase family protein n=1 Tax=Elizabethkingia sp. JS20170427COW TaxID=2583851 RepID=UPI001110A5E0|nr:TlpA disulfide reductase family protein [Elizabethkingia sp. JS20170427COW]QCX52361.1 TlpA family protein disulfide reductase [Elizabethkingia sp. JS20170427COW]
MKKLFLGIIIATTFMACKKQDSPLPTTSETEIAKDSLGTTSDLPSQLPELKENEIAELLKTKDNDTLYITNFFATWCGPCMIEIPHFKEEMEKLKNEKVKFTFVSVDQRDDWETKVKEFGNIQGLNQNIVLFDMYQASPDFASKNTQQWKGDAIPFTRMSKGQKVDETVGTLSKEDIRKKIQSFQ